MNSFKFHLGAVKMNGLLPWEIDADILLAPENFTAFGKLEPIFRRAGNTLEKVEKPPKHYVSHTSEWNIDIYFIDGLDSVQAKLQVIISIPKEKCQNMLPL